MDERERTMGIIVGEKMAIITKLPICNTCEEDCKSESILCTRYSTKEKPSLYRRFLKLEEENKKLIEALQFYSDADNVFNEIDNGEVCEKALGVLLELGKVVTK